MLKRKGITVMTVGLLMGILLLIGILVLYFFFYEGDTFSGFLKGLADTIRGFMGIGGGSGW
jgi:hypothetical protein